MENCIIFIHVLVYQRITGDLQWHTHNLNSQDCRMHHQERAYVLLDAELALDQRYTIDTIRARPRRNQALDVRPLAAVGQ